MVSISQAPRDETLRRIQRIQGVTIIWMSIEGSVSVLAAWVAHSPALLAFGGDSVIELLSAVVVLWQFSLPIQSRRAETRAARVAGALLFALAAYVTVVSVMILLGRYEPRPSFVGIAILIAALAIMPWLAYNKRKLSAAMGSAALRADAAQSSLCAYLSLIALVGLAVNAIWHIAWADPFAALAITPLILREAKESFRGQSCGCC